MHLRVFAAKNNTRPRRCVPRGQKVAQARSTRWCPPICGALTLPVAGGITTLHLRATPAIL
nr:hypothetical protein RVX_3034 [Nitratidesulfovibrio sp. HK-II]